MLVKQYRLKRQRDFLRVYRRGRSRVYPGFVLHYRPNGGNTPRFGFSVSKKVGNAVTRNRVKRRLRHGVRECMDKFPRGNDYVLVVRSAAVGFSYQKLLNQLRRAAADGAAHGGSSAGKEARS